MDKDKTLSHIYESFIKSKKVLTSEFWERSNEYIRENHVKFSDEERKMCISTEHLHKNYNI